MAIFGLATSAASLDQIMDEICHNNGTGCKCIFSHLCLFDFHLFSQLSVYLVNDAAAEHNTTVSPISPA